MTDARDPADPKDPTQLREEVGAELDQLVEDASEDERSRMAERDELEVDEPNDTSA